MICYLSGPMRGYEDLNRPAFHHYAAELKAQGHEVFNPAEFKIRPNADDRMILAYELWWLCMHAEAIALMPGFEDSGGAMAELAAAKRLGLKVMLVGEHCVG